MAVGSASDVPGEGSPEPLKANFPSWARLCRMASVLAQSTKCSILTRIAPRTIDPVLPALPVESCAEESNSSSPAGTILSNTRMALTTGLIATQGTSRSTPPERWLPCSSTAVLYSRPRIRCRPVTPSASGSGSGQQPDLRPRTTGGVHVFRSCAIPSAGRHVSLGRVDTRPVLVSW
jgi:hypothetical protein